MSIAVVILAGGIGSRMGSDRPKQFIEVDGKPIIIHTMDNFIKNPRVDSLSVVCEEHWIDHLAQLLERFDIKGVDIIPGGKTSHDSIRNGVFSLEDKLSDDDYVIIHDAARPVIPQFVIDDLIDVATEHGNACSTLPFYEPVMISDDGVSAVKEISRKDGNTTYKITCKNSCVGEVAFSPADTVWDPVAWFRFRTPGEEFIEEEPAEPGDTEETPVA